MTEVIKKRKPLSVILKETGRHVVRNENFALGAILAGLVAVMGIATHGKSITVTNASNILLQSATRGVAAIGQAFVILTAGIDLSPGGLALLTSIVGASMTTGTAGFPAGPIAAMLLIGLGVGASTGFLVSRVPMPALIVTLAMWQILTGAAWVTCAGRPIYNLPLQLAFIGQGKIGLVPMPAIIFIVLTMIAYFALYHTGFGRSVYATGGNPVSAWLSGVNVPNIILSVYAFAGLCSALAGVIIMSRTMSGSLTASGGLELDSITAVCIGGVSLMGGRGTLIGVVMGVFIISIINNGMNLLAVHPAFQVIVKGAIIVLAVAIDYRRRR